MNSGLNISGPRCYTEMGPRFKISFERPEELGVEAGLVV